ncbi:MAG: F0F1 ATP synthase subunit B [Betaproteobacteria bacterium RIFCSPLOWO2_12_FULL_63_13]|nr:MAG: F0F1 ATP synthase subunit B [Betaproteobacteria bacterium RIFCSPLOWO2_02_FULL_63_19]OGA47634.1 MAG: F0F1 ATP synthase subunit B [Betaproteobacteria bacterium RIFCSPLOWO2_12_FULL_63_13]
MLIDWFTVGAQVLNFLILAWLLKRFLYQPILDAIDAREKRIAKELADADAKRTEARKELDEFQRRIKAFDLQRSELLGNVIDEANAERQRLLDDVRQSVDALAAKRREALRSEQRILNEALRSRAREEVFAIARKTLADLASISLEERIGEVLIRRLRGLDAAAKASMGEALSRASGPVLVRSAFDLPDAQRAAIRNALNESFSADVKVRFETAPDLVSGIELATDSQKLTWNIADYLSSLEESVGKFLKDADNPETIAALKPEAEKSEPQAKTL